MPILISRLLILSTPDTNLPAVLLSGDMQAGGDNLSLSGDATDGNDILLLSNPQ
jgi:hypothetical protein